MVTVKDQRLEDILHAVRPFIRGWEAPHGCRTWAVFSLALTAGAAHDLSNTESELDDGGAITETSRIASAPRPPARSQQTTINFFYFFFTADYIIEVGGEITLLFMLPSRHYKWEARELPAVHPNNADCLGGSSPPSARLFGVATANTAARLAVLHRAHNRGEVEPIC